MLSTRKKKHENRRLFSQLDDFDQNYIIANAAKSGQQTFIVNDGTVNQEFTVNISGSIPTTNENTVNVQTLESCFNERIDEEMGNIVETVENRIQNAITTAVDEIITPMIELAVSSMNTSSGSDNASVTKNSERGNV